MVLFVSMNRAWRGYKSPRAFRRLSLATLYLAVSMAKPLNSTVLSTRMQLSLFTSLRTRKANTLSGTLLLTSWLRRWRNSILAFSSALVRLWRMVSSTTLCRSRAMLSVRTTSPRLRLRWRNSLRRTKLSFVAKCQRLRLSQSSRLMVRSTSASISRKTSRMAQFLHTHRATSPTFAVVRTWWIQVLSRLWRLQA